MPPHRLTRKVFEDVAILVETVQQTKRVSSVTVTPEPDGTATIVIVGGPSEEARRYVWVYTGTGSTWEPVVYDDVPYPEVPTPVETLISKTTYEFAVLHPTADPPTDLEDAMFAADQDNAVGFERVVSTEYVPDGQVDAELVAMGSEGGFFDDDFPNAEIGDGGPADRERGKHAVGEE